MRCLERNKQLFYYCLYETSIESIDEYGNTTGQRVTLYQEAVPMEANISASTGQAQTEQFGNLETYDKVIVTDWMDCPIDEHTVLFIDSEPKYSSAVDVPVIVDQEVIIETRYVPKYNYIVKRIAKSLNSISIAVRKVDVS